MPTVSVCVGKGWRPNSDLRPSSPPPDRPAISDKVQDHRAITDALQSANNRGTVLDHPDHARRLDFNASNGEEVADTGDPTDPCPQRVFGTLDAPQGRGSQRRARRDARREASIGGSIPTRDLERACRCPYLGFRQSGLGQRGAYSELVPGSGAGSVLEAVRRIAPLDGDICVIPGDG